MPTLFRSVKSLKMTRYRRKTISPPKNISKR
jgi:hypothetical protein